MNIINIEIKSAIKNPSLIISLLKKKKALFVGEDKQTDTYFIVDSGRLKLREGNIENALIYYSRPESKKLKRSDVKIQELTNDSRGIKSILERTHGVLAVVEKTRKIFFIDNVKFHIDFIIGLGDFVEIEASDSNGRYSELDLNNQCEFYIKYLCLDKNDFIDKSYSDLVIRVRKLKGFKEKLETA